jgi:AcrR family transcriptional regulator
MATAQAARADETAVSPTRDRLIAFGADLFQHQGLAATGIKQVLDAAAVQFSSLYHHFPGGKAELAKTVITWSGERYRQLVEAVWDGADDPVSSVTAVFAGAAATLEATDFAVACPIATVALEVTNTNDELRATTADVFESWVSSSARRLSEAGIPPDQSRDLAFVLISLLEGAFLLSQTAKNSDPMKAAGSVAVDLVERALAAKPKRSRPINKTSSCP